MIIEALGASPVSDLKYSAVKEFRSLLSKGVSKAFGEDSGRYGRRYTTTRGMIVRKDDLRDINSAQIYYFQFNPSTLSDAKTTTYSDRTYIGLAYNDHIWANGGDRSLHFQLFIDNTPQSHIDSFRPTARESKLAPTIKAGDKGNRIEPTKFEWVMNGAYSKTRIDKRGVLDEVEFIQSFLYPQVLVNEKTPKFAEGGIVSSNQFRPPATAVLSLGPIYLEGIIKSAPVNYTLFDEDLTPIRATMDIEFVANEFKEITRQI